MTNGRVMRGLMRARETATRGAHTAQNRVQFSGPLRMFAFDFDPSLPTVAVSEFSAGERRVHAGEAFDWRAHGMSEVEVLPLLRAGFLRQERPPAPDSPGWHALEVNATARRAIDEPSESKLVTLTITPGEPVSVEAPAQRRGRRR